MLGQSEILNGRMLARPQTIPKEITIEPIYKCGDDFYQRTVNKYNNTRYYKLLKRYGSNPNYPQSVYIMIDKRHNGHIDTTIYSYTIKMKKLIDNSPNQSVQNLSEDDAVKYMKLKDTVEQLQALTKYNQYGQFGVKCNVNSFVPIVTDEQLSLILDEPYIQ
ncbi:MAG: hypothetical protein EZS28_041683 [Streblomastix strix]|uniref:Uncharacterized protein n=1 Tax=Streblomastix strix TaxID=222440 RepID=A0A5J4TYS0_9EUKA|nr:MAG: hypothetical protein EZS28_041683 [Streblomastix strix]